MTSCCQKNNQMREAANAGTCCATSAAKAAQKQSTGACCSITNTSVTQTVATAREHASGQHAADHDHDHDHVHEHNHEHTHTHAHGGCCGHDHASHAATSRVSLGEGGDARFLTKFQILAMDCPTESGLIEKALSKVSGVRTLEFNYIERVMVMGHDLDDVTPVVRAIRGVGMEAVELTAEQAAAMPAERKISWRQRGLFALSGVFAAGAEAVAIISGSDTSVWIALLALASIACGGLPILKKGWIALKTGSMNIHFLMSVAVIGAIAIGQWPEAAMVLFLFAVAEKLEDMSLTRAGEAVKSLMALAPETAWIQREGNWVEVPVAEVAVGTRVRVRPGERVPLDGMIVSGASHFNEAPITGESLPVSKEPNSTVFAGSINGDGVVEIQTTAAASGSVLARIITTVRDAQASKAPIQRFIDRFARFYTPTVVVAAVLVAVLLPLFGVMPLKSSVYTALVMLVIACPCALVIATPVTLVSALASSARYGMLIKGGAPLEMAAKINAIAFDKTGTLTLGEPEVTQVIVPQGSSLTENRILALAAALDAHSTHPLASAVLRAAAARQALSKEPSEQNNPHASEIQELVGFGVQGHIEGNAYWLGSRRLAERRQVLTAAQAAELSALEAQGQGLLLLMSAEQLLGILTVADKIRPEAAQVIRRLNQQGIHTVMLSGDHQGVASAVARQIGVEEAQGELLPQDKLERITELQARYQQVAMIGDGVNDAPALARADLGIAMGAAGSDTALETAGVALMEDRLDKLPDLFAHARRTSRVLKANIAMALGIKAVFFALAMAGVATLWMAVFADVGASLLVIANGLRMAKDIQRA